MVSLHVFCFDLMGYNIGESSRAQSILRAQTWSITLECNDGSLIQKCKEGDTKAFYALVQRYQKKLFSVAFGMVHHPDDAMDVVQEAFLKAYRYLPKFQGNSSFYTWLYRIVVNLCIDFLRKEGRYRSVDYDDALEITESKATMELPGPGLPCEGNPMESLKNKELGEQIWSAIQCLSPNHRAVITLREIEQMSYEDIAATLECSKGTVMSRLHHARAKLREILNSYVQSGESISKKEQLKNTPVPSKSSPANERLPSIAAKSGIRDTVHH